MRWLVALGGLLAIGAMGAPAPRTIAPGAIATWSASNGTRSWTSGGVTATLSSRGGLDGLTVLTISAAGMAPFRFVAADSVAHYPSRIAIGPLARGTGAGVLLQTYTGGAHCCMHVVAVVPGGRAFRTVDFGEWDGDGIAWPRDRDGDGVADFVFGDNAFLYAFGSYADSWAPPLVMTIRGGKAADVSTARAFRPLFQVDLAKTRKACFAAEADFAGGPCAAYLADAARLGEFGAAWAELARTGVLARAGFPDRCTEQPRPDPCYRDFATGVRGFLRKHGYLR